MLNRSIVVLLLATSLARGGDAPGLSMGHSTVPTPSKVPVTVVSGAAKHFSELTVDNSGALLASGSLVGTVNAAGNIELASGFSGSSIGGAIIKFVRTPAQVGRVNANGTKVLTPAGLPVPRNWAASLGKQPAPRPKVTGPVNLEGYTNFNPDETNLKIKGLKLFVNSMPVARGGRIEVPGDQPVRLDWVVTVANPRSPGKIDFQARVKRVGSSFVSPLQLVGAGPTDFTLKTVPFTLTPGEDFKIDATASLVFKDTPVGNEEHYRATIRPAQKK